MLTAPQFERGFSSPSHIEIIESLSQLSAISGEWWALWHTAPRATPFSSPAWLLCWARHYAPERTRAIAIREHGVLVALLPFFTWRGALLLAGTGPTDYGEALIQPGREELAQTLLQTLATQAEAIDCARMDLQQLAANSPLLRARPPESWRSETQEGDVCPVACAQGEDGMECASRALRADLRRSLRKLQQEGEVELGGARAGELRSAARTLEWLHGRRWRQRGERGKLADPLMCAFLRSLVPEL
ncbi:MAG TPA: GNAT family N-acetyltransferase, partial [Rhodanobacteraceae bacterium]|nr:GNAT family N-acetyltransferase [Rhodanobacteraceae bacterium]